MIESQRKIPTLKLKARVCTLAIKEGGKTENSAKYKSVGFGTRGPCAAKTRLGFGVFGKAFSVSFWPQKVTINLCQYEKGHYY